MFVDFNRRQEEKQAMESERQRHIAPLFAVNFRNFQDLEKGEAMLRSGADGPHNTAVRKFLTGDKTIIAV